MPDVKTHSWTFLFRKESHASPCTLILSFVRNLKYINRNLMKKGKYLQKLYEAYDVKLISLGLFVGIFRFGNELFFYWAFKWFREADKYSWAESGWDSL